VNATGLAEVVVPAGSLHDALPFWIQGLGFRLEAIHPADSPRVAVVSGHGVRLRLEHGADVAPGRIRLLVEDPSALEGPAVRVAPGGTVVEILPRNVPLAIPKAVHVFDVRRLRDGAPWVVEEGDAWVVPPGMPVTFRDVSADLEYVEASLPAGFRTEVLSAG
jgi:hypothetical protein